MSEVCSREVSMCIESGNGRYRDDVKQALSSNLEGYLACISQQ
jgi:hypothetical protein